MVYDSFNRNRPMTEYATAADFCKWEEQAKAMTIAQLLYAAKDCREAEAANRGWNLIKEGYYSDQAATFSMELNHRKAAA